MVALHQKPNGAISSRLATLTPICFSLTLKHKFYNSFPVFKIALNLWSGYRRLEPTTWCTGHSCQFPSVCPQSPSWLPYIIRWAISILLKHFGMGVRCVICLLNFLKIWNFLWLSMAPYGSLCLSMASYGSTSCYDSVWLPMLCITHYGSLRLPIMLYAPYHTLRLSLATFDSLLLTMVSCGFITPYCSL